MCEADVRWGGSGSARGHTDTAVETARTMTPTARRRCPQTSLPHSSTQTGSGRGLLTPALPLLLLAISSLAILSPVAAADAASSLSARVDADLTAHNMSRCPEEHLCRLGEKRPRREEFWEERGCMCDLACGTFGDCCRDAPAAAETPRGDIVCRDLRHYDGIYMVSSCPADWRDAAVARLCARPPALVADPVGGLPVTSPASRLTYRNYYCAMCHADVADAVFWRTRVECPTLTSSLRGEMNVTPEFTADNLRQDADGQWGVGVGEGPRETFHVCEIDPFFPETVEFLLRRCRISVADCATDAAAATGSDDASSSSDTDADASAFVDADADAEADADADADAEAAELCGAYTAYVYDIDNRAYRNPHCALCRGLPADEVSCLRRPTVRSGLFGRTFNTRSFSILLDIGDRSGSDDVGAVDACVAGQLWDPFFKRCRDVVCDAQGYVLRDGVCVPDPDAATGGDGGGGNATSPSDGGDGGDFARPISNATQPTAFLLCPKYFLNASDFEPVDNGSVYVPLYDRTFGANEFELRDGELVICAVTADLGKFDLVLSYISVICLAASVLCLVLHLLAFCLVSEIRNLSGRNLAALSVCLLVGYVCFLVLPSQTPGEPGCAAVAVVMFTAFIASFFWMNVMAFDVFTTLRKATKELRVASGRRLGRFLAYSVYVCLMTAGVLTAAMIAEHADAVPATYRPGFGDRVCWFSRRRALMAFFAVPLAAVMGVNVVLFVASALMVRQTTKSTRSMTCGPSKVNLRLYSRLAVIMGLSWVVGLVAGWLDFSPLWYAFVVLNTLQGVFIFVSFTLGDKVRDRVARRAASWSSRGADRSMVDSNVNTDSSGLTVSKTRL